jgi:hypothetical protein
LKTLLVTYFYRFNRTNIGKQVRFEVSTAVTMMIIISQKIIIIIGKQIPNLVVDTQQAAKEFLTIIVVSCGELNLF